MADLVGQPKIQFSRWRQVKVWLWETLQHVFAGGVDRYAQANQALYAAYRRHYQPDGEINFLRWIRRHRAREAALFY